MKLKFVETDRCPTCGCNVVVMESIRNNGEEIFTFRTGSRWENRRFLCGTEIGYHPNLQCELIESKCNKKGADGNEC